MVPGQSLRWSPGPWVRGASRAGLCVGRGRAPLHAPLSRQWHVPHGLPALQGMVLDDTARRAASPCPVLLCVQRGHSRPGTGYSTQAALQLVGAPGPALCSLDLPGLIAGRSGRSPQLWPGARSAPHLGPGAEASGSLGRGQGAPVSVGRQAGLGGTAVGLPAGWGPCLGPSTHSGLPCSQRTCSAAAGPARRRRARGPAWVLGGAHISTFDEKQYRVPGDCSYVKAKVRGLPGRARRGSRGLGRPSRRPPWLWAGGAEAAEARAGGC